MSARKFDFNALALQEGIQAEVKLTSPEDPQDKSLRIFKDRTSFIVKDIGPYVLAGIFVVAMSFYCFAVLNGRNSTEPDKARAWPALLAILGGVVGVVFGKATASK